MEVDGEDVKSDSGTKQWTRGKRERSKERRTKVRNVEGGREYR